MYSSTLFLTWTLEGGWVVNATPRPLYPRERPGTHCIGCWLARSPVWTITENLPLVGIIHRTVQLIARRDTHYNIPAHYTLAV